MFSEAMMILHSMELGCVTLLATIFCMKVGWFVMHLSSRDFKRLSQQSTALHAEEASQRLHRTVALDLNLAGGSKGPAEAR